MEIRVKNFEQLTTDELYDLLRLRSEIFVVEQDCVYQDMDGKDRKAVHLFGMEEGMLVACTRCFMPGDYFKEASIGRIAVSSQHRGKQLGHNIVQASIDLLRARCGNVPIRISAQTYLEDFYRTHGFIPTGRPYLEDGIPHIAMVKKG